MKRYKTIIFILITISIHSTAFPQDGVRLWYGHSVQARINKEWRVSAGQLFIFGRDPFQLSTLQNSLNVSYRYTKRVRLGFGYLKSINPQSTSGRSRNRLTGRVDYRIRLENFWIQNAFRVEWHFPERSKFQYRLRYAFRIHPRGLDLPLRARPFVTNEFHYYLSGRPLWYRDEQGEKVIRQSPNGLHAHRLTLGLRITPVKRLNVTFRFMRQTEFNLGNKYRKINVEDPRDGRIRRRFNNFSALVVTGAYRLKL
ncbi:DUF2490 domain-containing protein [Fulvivirgaceae bacterium BMA12]|uniref:DUF2490 domain-containing protein n=1 Tax=Agaribacillus aureus TaxID=3051825 RepID=A0ABT8L0T8_9BACT|nr:DUF2490 domain-containing protein [Fulvivirgaceae bacterium BMA12]